LRESGGGSIAVTAVPASEARVSGCSIFTLQWPPLTAAISLENKAKIAASKSDRGRTINQSAMVSALLL
jgi:hypothetical protein